ncbi:transcription factor bHLH30-like [Tasmannia lanceolata]|uniref:transcription factor bHLH30-like n=1 Tax=Tasmannia lanceolata TaxID=3420 RepID=UPI0040647EA4
MCGKKMENQEESSQMIHEFYQEQLFQEQHQQQYNDSFVGGPSSILPWSLPPVHSFNPVQFATNPGRDHDHFLSSSPYGGLYNRRAAALQFAYDGSTSDHLGLASLYVGSDPLGQSGRAGSSSFGLGSELGKMTAQDRTRIMDAKALAASKSHSEAERRRRERINTHLAKLRSLLPSTTKTDKASLLAEVIQHVKDLKRQTLEIAEVGPVPTEVDELTLETYDEDGKFLIKASLCCEDRSDLLPDLIKTLKALRLRALKAEITTLAGRVKNVLLITEEEESKNNDPHSINSIQDALRAVMERTSDDSSSGSIKRQRTNVSILEHRPI